MDGEHSRASTEAPEFLVPVRETCGGGVKSPLNILKVTIRDESSTEPPGWKIRFHTFSFYNFYARLHLRDHEWGGLLKSGRWSTTIQVMLLVLEVKAISNGSWSAHIICLIFEKIAMSSLVDLWPQ
jgi:hypothetical protein